MRRGGGKQKGSAFEREVCKALSLWVSHGKDKDLFWRSAMSGGRATRAGGSVRQAGDICAVAPEGHSLTNSYYFELKFMKNLALANFFIEGGGILWKFWEKACKEGEKYNRHPVVIAKQNLYPTIVLIDEEPLRAITTGEHLPVIMFDDSKRHELVVCLFDDLLQTKYRVPRVRVR